LEFNGSAVFAGNFPTKEKSDERLRNGEQFASGIGISFIQKSTLDVSPPSLGVL
jgi:hypothetical protein